MLEITIIILSLLDPVSSYLSGEHVVTWCASESAQLDNSTVGYISFGDSNHINGWQNVVVKLDDNSCATYKLPVSYSRPVNVAFRACSQQDCEWWGPRIWPSSITIDYWTQAIVPAYRDGGYTVFMP